MTVCLLPLTDVTRDISDAAFFDEMKTGSVFINVGRGQHLVLPDLLAALERGHLCAAVLDVFNVEPLPSEDPLWSDPRIIITPHMASAVSDSNIANQIIGNVLCVLNGLALQNTISSALQH
jgi:glyoxylate/hydroxypyruvate reductase A